MVAAVACARAGAARARGDRCVPFGRRGRARGRAAGGGGDRDRARDDRDRRAGARGLPAQRARPLLLLQDRALRVAGRSSPRGAATRRCCRARTPTTPATGGPGCARPPSTACATRCSRPAPARPRCARWRASSGCRAPRSRRRRAWRRASRTARRSSPATLALIDRAERAVRALGFPIAARAPPRDPRPRRDRRRGPRPRAATASDELVAAVRAAGYRHAVLDREPFRSGRLNDVLGVTSRA